MIVKTKHTVPINLINDIKELVSVNNFRHSVNQPTGNFFYDPWEIKPEYKNTAWDELLKTLPLPVGEARIIVLNQTDCYSSHCDIDDRWHLNISSKNGYLINLDTEDMFKLNTDGIWYEMDAGNRHTAVNFGNRPRIQFVVRKLLSRSTKLNLTKVSITTKLTDLEDARYEFDNSISSFLNKLNKLNAINNFEYTNSIVSMDLASEYINELVDIAGDNFEVKYD